ncbi:MAG: LptF/LptG family permease, partial [Saprospiraceae bacterium]|nr:LptF/LptG family permease [Saprospiraceae bacterium]
MRIKKLDALLIKSFLPPFVLATFIALFVLIMQTLWLYIDDILGKGANMFIVMEFLFYLSMSLVPLALPIGVLLASVMLFGNLGEKYELSSMKSAGISLFRIMMPLIALCMGIAAFSWVCNEYIIPYSNLKFKSRLYDLRKSRPALNLEEGVFNDDFDGYVIHIGKKEDDDRHIRDVLIYDHQHTASKGETNIIRAKSGEMYATEDNDFFVMKLYDGHMYQEMSRRASSSEGKYPFIRSSFDEWTKIFDLRQFELNRTDEDLFKSNQSMKNSAQLSADIDSMRQRLSELRMSSVDALTEIYQSPEAAEMERERLEVQRLREQNEKDSSEKGDSTDQKDPSGKTSGIDKDEIRKALLRNPDAFKTDVIDRRTLDGAQGGKWANRYEQIEYGRDTISFFYQTFPESKHLGLLNTVENEIKVSRQRHSSNQSAYLNVGEKVIKH